MSKPTTPIRTALSLLLCLVVFVSTGCNIFGGDVSIVKNGSLDFDRSITIGQAFAGYKYFKNKSWKAIKDEQGRRFVIFTGVVDNNIPEIKEEYSRMNFVSETYECQFVINSDNSFSMVHCSWNTLSTNQTNQHLDGNASANSMLLRSIYANKPPMTYVSD